MASTVDPSTSVYQSVIASLQAYPQLGGNGVPGVGVIRTWLDPSQPNFQLLLKKYGSGDTPALLVLPVRDNAKPWGNDSMSYMWEMDLGIAITSDWEAIQPMNQAVWLTRLAFIQAPANLGSPYIMPGAWTLSDGRQSILDIAGSIDKAAGTDHRWRALMMLHLKCLMSFTAAQALAASWVIA